MQWTSLKGTKKRVARAELLFGSYIVVVLVAVKHTGLRGLLQQNSPGS